MTVGKVTTQHLSFICMAKNRYSIAKAKGNLEENNFKEKQTNSNQAFDNNLSLIEDETTPAASSAC